MRTIILSTNINGKLNNDSFIHITLAPKEPVSEKNFPIKVLVKTKDESYPDTECMIHDMYRLQLKDLANLECWQSHGVPASVFIHEHAGAGASDQELAVYFYSKCVATGQLNSPIVSV